MFLKTNVKKPKTFHDFVFFEIDVFFGLTDVCDLIIIMMFFSADGFKNVVLLKMLFAVLNFFESSSKIISNFFRSIFFNNL